MKRITFLSLALITGLCLQPLAAFAQDQVPAKDDKKEAKAAPHGTKVTTHAAKHVQLASEPGAASGGYKSHSKISKSSAESGSLSKSTSARSSDVATQSQGSQQNYQRQSSQQQNTAIVVQGNQANHYDGRWSSASSHSDWDQQTNHRWHNHDYRWYDGGWLIIETSSAPDYSAGGSTGSQVQARLAQQGYYNGPIDGDIGYGTRRAISHYESDNGLQVNGQIDEPLLASLRLE
jgi:hypothetical protein